MAGILEDVYSEEEQKDANKEYWRGYREGKQEILDKYTEIKKQNEQKPVEKPINWTELTWKDIVELEGIINNVHYEFRNGIGQESFGKEVLEKFREYKGDEYLDEIRQNPTEQLSRTFTSYDMAKTFVEGQNYVMNHPEKFGLCKSIEQNENNKECPNKGLGIAKDFFGIYKRVCTLNSEACEPERCLLLTNNSQSNPAECSEDEKTVQLIKKVLYDSKNGVEHMIGDTDYYKCLTWIERKKESGIRNTDALEKWLKESVSKFISQLEYGSTIDIDTLISDMRKQDFYNDLLKNYKL